MNDNLVKKIIDLALEEDLGFGDNLVENDLTSNLILTNQDVNFAIVAREDLLLCGTKIIETILDRYLNSLSYKLFKKDGEFIKHGTQILVGSGNAKIIFALERTIINFLQHCSGISSLTKKFVEAISSTNTIIRSTRKTTPGLRVIEKYAVSIGGGENYRTNLTDGILIKDNHIASCGGVDQAITLVKNKILNNKNLSSFPIAVECDTIAQVEIATSIGVDMILLDNMNVTDIKKAVKICNNKNKLEASGGINLKTVFEIASTGVNYISVGAITHSFTNVDIALDII